MSDDDNYTIDEPDEPPVEESIEPEDAPVGRDAAAIVVLVAGLVTIAGAAYCGTVQLDFQQGTPDKATFFVTSLTLPLSIVGALLTVVAVCVLVFRLRLPRQGE